MLILVRKMGETIVIGDDIKVQVLGIRGQQVRIGIDAPREVSVHREEIYNKVLLDREREQIIAKEEIFND